MSQSGVSEQVRPVVMELSREDIGAMSRRFPNCNSLSPFFEEQPNNAAPSENLKEFSQQPMFDTVMEILTQPELMVHHRLADSTSGLTMFSAFFSREQPNTIAVLYPSKSGGFYLRVFTGVDQYLAWWLGIVGTKTDRTSENLLPAEMSMESFVYTLHAIDSYRGAQYKAALDFDSNSRGYVNADDYGKSLLKSMASQNYFWLLPSFLRATAELQDCEIMPGPDDLNRLVAMDILKPGKAQGQDVLAFGAASEKLGTEFKFGFNASMGLVATVQSPDGKWVSQRLYLAPTAATNHVFEVNPTNSNWTVRHSTATINELVDQFTKLILNGIRASSQPVPVHARMKPAAAKVSPVSASKQQPQTNVQMQGAAAAAAKPKPATAQQAKAAWRKLNPRFIEDAARSLLRSQPSAAADKSMNDLFKARDRKGTHWRYALNSYEWYTVADNKWVPASPPDEFWMEEEAFQKLQQVQ
jgi:hypothetical protein